MVRFHRSTGAACRYWRPQLQLSDHAAHLAPHPDRQAPLTVAGGDHRGQVEHRPAITGLAVGRKLMLVTVEAGEGAEFNHGVSVRRGRINA